MNARRIAGALAAVLIAMTVVSSRPADAAGDTYVWVATAQGDFANPLNWERAADGEPGVPGPGDVAQIVDPPGLVTVTTAVTVAGLTVVASTDAEELDFGIYGFLGGSLTVTSAWLGGDVWIRGPLTAEDLTITGTTAVDSSITLAASTPGEPAHLVLDEATMLGTATLDDGPVAVEVAGEGPSTVETLAVTDAEVRLTSEDGATFAGRVYGGDVEVIGDVPPDARVASGLGPAGGGTLSWSEPDDAVLAGHVIVSGNSTGALPDDLTIEGILDLVGPASGGSVEIAADGGLRFTDRGPDGHRVADLVLTGTFASDPTGGIWIDPADTTCVGDEDLLIRAAGGVTFPPGEVHLDAPETWFDLEGVALGDDLVAVARRTDDDVQDQCVGGASERVVRSMYRDLLGRRGDAGGAAYWAGKLDGGTSATTIAARLLATDEAWVHLARSTWEAWSCDGEPPSDAAVDFMATFLRGGGSLSSLRADVVAGTIPSGGDPVDCLYRAALGRAPDAGGRAYAEARLESESVQTVARRLITSPEGRRVRINRLYRPLLGRAATSGEVTVRIAQLRQGRTEVRVMEQLAGTDEYIARASR